MQLREALLRQAPSLALQRAAADEIARLDAQVTTLRAQLEQTVPLPAIDSLWRTPSGSLFYRVSRVDKHGAGPYDYTVVFKYADARGELLRGDQEHQMSLAKFLMIVEPADVPT